MSAVVNHFDLAAKINRVIVPDGRPCFRMESMKSFFSTLGRWLGRLRNILLNAIFILSLLMIAAIFFAEQPAVPDDAALILNPTGTVVEEMALPTTSGLPLSISAPEQTQLRDLVTVIRRAANDSRIRLIVLKLDEMGKSSMPVLQALRREIEAFRKSGKMVIAIGPNYSQSQYYLAATADQLFVDPLGVVGLNGFAIYRNYIHDALDSLGIDIQLFRAGRYKSAIEPLVRNDMSDDVKQANRALLDVLWSRYKNDLAAMRNIKAERLQQLLDHPSRYLAEAAGSTALLAKAEGLVDAIADRGAIENYIAGAMGVTSGEYRRIEFRPYLRASGDLRRSPGSEPQVAIVTASGMILGGKQPPGTVGDTSMIGMLEQARNDAAIKAVVVRIDSPGGSAQASEAIRSEIARLRKAGKPVVVSMGGMAASGGYWMATAADQIWASPTTITGSIGAFGVLPTLQRGLEKLGVHSDGIATTSIAGGIRTDRPLPSELKQVMELSMGYIYQQFLQRVAEGRKLAPERVAALAEGRVWSGEDAKRLGLVDELGGLTDAVKGAAKLAGIAESYRSVRINQPLGLREMLMIRLMGEADALIPRLLAETMMRASALLPETLIHQFAAVSQLVGLSPGQPGIFAMCDLRVE